MYSSDNGYGADLRMADVSGKEKTLRTARASGFIKMGRDTLEKVRKKEGPKGDVLSVAKVAGIIAVKQTPFLIPMCHNIDIAHCSIEFKIEEGGIGVVSEVKSFDRTGAEMEALTAVSVVLLNIYDMLKALERSMEIVKIKLDRKTGGKSGDYVRED
ncbi:MAG: cyclic pyranopterin monophosphate synthase MoaC [Elusimicrobiota bacterium]